MIQMRQGAVPERVIANTILSELKRAVLTYTEAAMEVTVPDVKRTFERLAQDTIRKYEQMLAMMKQNHMLDFPPPAGKHEVQREAQRSRNTAQALQRMMAQGGTQPASNPYTQGVPSYNSYMNVQRNPQMPAYPPSGSRPPEYALPHMPAFVAQQGLGHLQPQTSYAPQLEAEPPTKPDSAGTAEPQTLEASAPAPDPAPDPAPAKRGRRSKAAEAIAPEDA